jgi:DNA-binding IclR family transcriptional regulator
MQQTGARSEGQQRRVQSIEVGFRVVRVLQAANGPLPLRDIAAAAGMPPSKAHLYLVSFVREGIADQDSRTGRYGLGPFAIQLGLAAIRQLDVTRLAQEELEELRAKTNCAAYLSLWGDRGPTIVSKVDGDQQGAFSLRLGYTLPPTTATGLVFRAFLPQHRTREAVMALEPPRKPPPGVKPVPKVEVRLEQIRKDGFATTEGLLNANYAAIAVPIFDHSGQIAAAMTLLARDSYLTGEGVKRALDELLQAAGRLSAKLGVAA